MDSSGLHRDQLGWWVWGFWPSVENYIVDASILDLMPLLGVSGHKLMVAIVPFGVWWLS